MVSGTIGENHLFDFFVAGKMLAAKIKGIEKKGSFTKISIGIYLVDF